MYEQRQVRQAAHVLAAGLTCPPSPPPSSYIATTPYVYPAAPTSALNTLSYASQQQDTRRHRSSDREKDQSTSVSLPSIHEALEAAQTSYNAQSTSTLAAQPYLPYSPTMPNCSRKIRPHDHNPATDRQTPPATRPPTSYHLAGREMVSSPRQPVAMSGHIDSMHHQPPLASVVPADARRPSYPGAAPCSPLQQHGLAPSYKGWQHHSRSIPAHATQDVRSVPARQPPPPSVYGQQQHYPLEHASTSQHTYLPATPFHVAPRSTYFPNSFPEPATAWKPREVEPVDDNPRPHAPRELGPSYGESVKRHLDVFDLESALNDVRALMLACYLVLTSVRLLPVERFCSISACTTVNELTRHNGLARCPAPRHI